MTTATRLTAREREVAALLAASRTTKQIAGYLHIKKRRVSQLIASVAAKIEADPNGDVRVAKCVK